MKSIRTFLLFALLFATAASANDAPAPVAGTSSVDLTCFDQLSQADTGIVTFDDVMGWLSSCRTAPLNQPGCIVVSGTYSSDCFSKANGFWNGTGAIVTGDQRKQIMEACKTVNFSCQNSCR